MSINTHAISQNRSQHILQSFYNVEATMSWDDGKHSKVNKVQLTFDDVIYSIQVTYDGSIQSHRRGSIGPKSAEFTLGSGEYITALSAYGKTLSSQDVITAMTFYTNKKSYGPYGKKSGYQISAPEATGKQIAGFFGTSGNILNSIDVHYAPLHTTIRMDRMVTPKKLEAKGANTGAVWDDGHHDNVKKVYVGKNQDGVGAVKFEYANGSQVVFGDEHGKKTMLGYEEFEIDADDSIVYVEGYREKVNGDEIIKALIFKTYKGKSQQFGTVSGTKFVLQGGRIVGFHGRSTDVLVALGAYISKSSTRNIRGEWIKVDQAGKAPGLRCSHAIAQIGNKIYCFGGEFIPNNPIDKDLYVFDIESRTWSISPATGDVPHLACLGVRMVSVGTTLYVFGGRDASRKYNGFYSFDTTKNEWKLLTPVEEGPAPRSFHSMSADENHVYVFGGVGAMKRLKTLDAYNIADKKWVKCSTPGDSFSIRGGSGLHVVDGKVWVIYGFNNYEIDDVHYYDLAKDEWTKVETFGEKPSGRSVFASAVVEKHIIIFGGEIDMDPQAHEGPGQLAGGTFALNTDTLVWERVDKLGEEEETPEIRGWAASTAGSFDGKKGLVMHGGKAQTNDRFDDLCFFGVENV